MLKDFNNLNFRKFQVTNHEQANFALLQSNQQLQVQTLKKEFDIDNINERLENGDLTALDELKKQGVSVTTAEGDPFVANDGSTHKITKFSYKYNGIRYTVTYNEKIETSDSSSTEVTPSVTKYTQAQLANLKEDEIAKYFTKQADGTYIMNNDAIKKDFPNDNIENPTQLKKAIDAKKADGADGNDTKVTQYTENELKNKYKLTTSDITHFFKKNGDKYEINQAATKSCFGKEISNVQDLLNAMQNDSISENYIKGAYNMGNTKYLQYFKETVVNGKRTYTMDKDKIKKDFPNQEINTIGQLKAAIDAKKTSGTSDNGKITSDFTTYEALQNYLTGAARTEIKNAGITDFSKVSYETIANTVAGMHKTDYANVTKQQLVNEFKTEYDKQVAAATKVDTTPTPTTTKKEMPKVADNAPAMPNGQPIPKYALENTGFTKEQIEKYFVYVGKGNNNYDFYILRSGITYEGKEIFSYLRLREAIKEYLAENPAGETKPNTTTPTTEPEKTQPNTDNTGSTGNTNNTLATAYTDLTSAINLAAKSTGYQAKLISSKMNGKFNFHDNGNIYFSDSKTTQIYYKVLDEIKYYIINMDKTSSLRTIGGEDTLTKLIQSAWLMTYSTYNADNTKIDTESFVNKLMENLKSILNNLAKNPDNLNYLTNNCYKDSSLADSSQTKINSVSYKKFDKDGLYHLDDTQSDKSFQAAMNTLLEKLYNKYPNISKAKLKELFVKAQSEALSSAKNNSDIPAGCTLSIRKLGKSVIINVETSISDMVQLVLYKFDKLFKAECLKSEFPAREVETPAAKAESHQTKEQNTSIKEGVKGILREVTDAINTLQLTYGQDRNKKIHTEFGMDSNGKIVFQDSATQQVYNEILNTLKSKIRLYSADALAKLGGESVLEMLVQNAWIAAYNNFDSSQDNNRYDFANKVMENLQKILNKLQTNPELLETFTKRSSYADTSVTNGVKHYNTKTTDGNDEEINTNGSYLIYADNTIHIDDTIDDNDYQSSMSDVLKNLITKYSSIDSSIITKIFREAQKKALDIQKGNIYDCPYGTGHNNGRVEDGNSKNWNDDHDNRAGDKGNIDIDQLVQLTLYCFDKLLTQELLK